MLARQFERTKERISAIDRKVMKDPRANNVDVVALKRSAAVVAVVGLVRGVCSFDLSAKFVLFWRKFLASCGAPHRYMAFADDAGGEAALLGEAVEHACSWAKGGGAEQVFALYAGPRADGERKWNPLGFKFCGVGPAPAFEVKLVRKL